MFEFNGENESCYFETPRFDVLPYLSFAIHYKETNMVKFGITIKFGWLLWQYRMFIGKHRLSPK